VLEGEITFFPISLNVTAATFCKCSARPPFALLTSFFFQRMYFSNTEPLTSLGCPLNAVFHVLRGPVPQDAETPPLSLLQIFHLYIISIAVLDIVPPTQGYRKEPPFSL
jgi:hypothetical protein